MKSVAPLSLAACLATTPVTADPAADYTRLRELLPSVFFGIDPPEHMAINGRIVQWMAGRWTMVSPLMSDGVTFPEADLVASACEKVAFDAAPAGNLGLTLTLPTRSDPYLIRLAWAGGTSWMATTDEAGFLARLFPDKSFEDLQPEMLASTYLNSSWQGYMSLLPVGNDLLLLQPLMRPPMLLVRCP